MGTFLGPGYGLWKVTFTLDGSVKIFQSAFMFKNNTAVSADSANALIRGYWNGSGKPFNSASFFTGYTWARSECYVNLGGDVTYDLDEVTVNGSAGTGTGTPINTSLIVKKNTALVGKRYRGRFMLPNMWVAETDINQAGIISPTPLATAQNLFTQLMSVWNVGPVPLVLGHTTSEVLPTPVSTLTVGNKVGSMPHRIRGY